MKTKNDKQLVVGLDIGTSKVVAIVGEYEPGEPITGRRFPEVGPVRRSAVVPGQSHGEHPPAAAA